MKLTLLLVTASLTLLAGSPAATADPASLIVDDTNLTLTGTADADRTVTVGLTNLTLTSLDFDVDAGANCTVSRDHEKLEPAEHTSVVVTVPATCVVPDTGLILTISADGAPQIPVTVTTSPIESTSWAWLRVFPYSIIVLLALALGLYLTLRNPLIEEKAARETEGAEPTQDEPMHNESAAAATQRWPRKLWDFLSQPQLPYLDKAFSFKDSWAGNVTIIGGILTGVFGTGSVVKALLGKDAESTIALATVGAAISVAFIAAGPIVMLSLKRDKNFTFIGLLVSGAITLAGAAGQLVVVSVVASKVDFGGTRVAGLGWYVGIAGTSLLVLYAARSVHEIVQDGITPPKTGDSDATTAAKLVANALRAATPVDNEVFDVAAEVPPQYLKTSPGDDRPRRAGTF